MNHSDADAFDVLPLLRGMCVCGGVIGFWLSIHTCFTDAWAALSSQIIPGFSPVMYYAGTVGSQPRSPAFYSSPCTSLNGNDVPFLWYFMFTKNQTFLRLSDILTRAIDLVYSGYGDVLPFEVVARVCHVLPCCYWLLWVFGPLFSVSATFSTPHCSL